MPRRSSMLGSKLPPRELKICQRVREAREIASVTQGGLAEMVGIPRDRLSTYEKGRAPLKCDLALRICRQLIISEEWLATGETRTFAKRISGPAQWTKFSRERVFPRYCLDLLSEPVARSIPPGMLFSQAFDTELRKAYEEIASRVPPLFPPRIILSVSLPEPELVARLIQVIFDRQLELINFTVPEYDAASWPIQRFYGEKILFLCQDLFRIAWHADFDLVEFQELFAPIHEYLDKFDDDQKERSQEINEARETGNTLGKKNVAEAESKHSLRFMLWPELWTWSGVRTQLRLALDSRRGAKASLARRFGVTTQAVSQWLSGASMPSADTAFHIRKLLADGSLTKPEEKKRAGRAATQPAPKTRKGKNKTNEKSKSDQRKE
jgi:transcriptional regulator with XRE-family HTH domain